MKPEGNCASTAATACEWCGRAIAQNADGRWYAVKGEERGYDPLTCDASDDCRHDAPEVSEDGARALAGLPASTRLTILAASIHALHYPAYNDHRRTPLCDECRGKAGTHPCGCWATHDAEIICGECSGRSPGGQSVLVHWPCRTVNAVVMACDD